MPADDGAGPNDHEDFGPTRPATSQDRPKQSIQAADRRPWSFAFEHGELLSKGKNLQGRIASTAAEYVDHGEDAKDEFGHGPTLVT
jgi:hypothetical protein